MSWTVGTAMTARISAGMMVHSTSSLVLPWVCFGIVVSPGLARNRTAATTSSTSTRTKTATATANTRFHSSSCLRATGPSGARMSCGQVVARHTRPAAEHRHERQRDAAARPSAPGCRPCPTVPVARGRRPVIGPPWSSSGQPLRPKIELMRRRCPGRARRSSLVGHRAARPNRRDVDRPSVPVRRSAMVRPVGGSAVRRARSSTRSSAACSDRTASQRSGSGSQRRGRWPTIGSRDQCAPWPVMRSASTRPARLDAATPWPV